jgi:hypothetical protein
MKFLFPIVSVLIAGTLFFVFIEPLYSDITQTKAEVAAYSSALDNSTYLQNTQDTLLSQYKNVQPSDLDRLTDFLPNTVDNIEFILQIEQVANIYNMPLKNIKFDANTPDSTAPVAPVSGGVLAAGSATADVPYGTFSLEFETEGTYAQFTSFLKDVEHNLRLVDVKSISFAVPAPAAKGTIGADPDVYDFTLKVDTYWLK